MHFETIQKDMEWFEGDVYYVSILDEFVWSETQKKVVGYHEQSSRDNLLVVLRTEPVDVSGKGLRKYLIEQEISTADVIVFCVNEDYYPKTPGRWALLKIIRKVNKKKDETKRVDTD